MKSIKKNMEIEYTILGSAEAVAKAKLVFETIADRLVDDENDTEKPYISFILENGDEAIEAAMMYVCECLKCEVHYISSDFRKNVYRKYGSHYKTLKYVVDNGCSLDYLPSIAKVKEWFGLEKYFSRETVRKLKTPEEIVKFIKHNDDKLPYLTRKVGVYEIENE